MNEHTLQLKRDIKLRADAHRKYRQEIDGLADKDIQIAMDEWNYWYGDYIYGELGVRYHLKDALGVAMGLHEYFRNSDIFFMANYAQTVNVIGSIKTTRTESGFAATGLPLKLYRREFGVIPVQVTGAPEDLDIAAALTREGDALTVAVVNATNKAKDITLDFGDRQVASPCLSWTIQNDDPESYNVPGMTPDVTIVESDKIIQDGKINVPAYAIVLYRFVL